MYFVFLFGMSMSLMVAFVPALARSALGKDIGLHAPSEFVQRQWIPKTD